MMGMETESLPYLAKNAWPYTDWTNDPENSVSAESGNGFAQSNHERVAQGRFGQYVKQMMDLPPDLNAITEARIDAEARGVDAELLRMRDMELAHLSLPPIIDGARRTRMLAMDSISTTWEGWSLTGGERVFMRCLRPRWCADPVMLRRMAQANGTALSWHADGDWPHLRAVVQGALLIDRFPVEDIPSTGRLARLLGGGLESLAALHKRGRVHGDSLASFIVESADRVQLIWLDPFDPQSTPADDLRALSRTIMALDPTGNNPVAQLAEEWSENPPPTAQDGIRLLVRRLSGTLLAERHRLSIAGRSAHRMGRTARLARAVRQLSNSMTPPPGKVCLRAGVDGVLVIADCDGESVRGGAVADVAEDRFLPIIFTPGQGLDAQSARFLLRSWALRAQGDETLRAEIQGSLGTTDVAAEHIVRWLSSMARLRAAKLLLAASSA